MIIIRIAKSCIKGKLNLTKIMQVYHSKFQCVWVKFNSPLFRRTSFSTYLKSVWTEFNASIWNVRRLSSWLLLCLEAVWFRCVTPFFPEWSPDSLSCGVINSLANWQLYNWHFSLWPTAIIVFWLLLSWLLEAQFITANSRVLNRFTLSVTHFSPLWLISKISWKQIWIN